MPDDDAMSDENLTPKIEPESRKNRKDYVREMMKCKTRCKKPQQKIVLVGFLNNKKK